MPTCLRLLALALVVTLLVFQPAPAAQAKQGERVLLAIYYPWFSPDSFDPALMADVPASPYDSDDPLAIGRQIEQAQAAGIDGFVVAWMGPGNRTDQNLGRMLDQAAERGFRVAVYLETHALGGPAEVAAGISYLLGTYGGHPSFLHKDGRPVLFLWRQQVFDPSTWGAIRAQVDPGWGSFWVAEGTTSAYLNAFDALHLYDISWAASPATPLETWATRTSAASSLHAPRVFVPTIMPGYNDLAFRAGRARDRQGGAYYRATMDAALAVEPQWAVIITSWNEWLEGTQIEPGAGYGDYYLHLTAEFAARLKG